MHGLWSVGVRHRGKLYEIVIESKEKVAEFQKRVYDSTRVLPEHQKWITPRNTAAQNPTLSKVLQEDQAESVSLDDTNVQDHAILNLIGATENEIEHMQAQEVTWAKRNAPRSFHPSMLKGMKPVFGSVAAHQDTPVSAPYHAAVIRYLERLANDSAVLHVCRTHDYRVGVLTELLPYEHPNLLGLNENRGERILLRIRTDAADGMRDYKTTRRVLMHELAHNEFKTLNSQLNAEVDAFERDQRANTHHLQTSPVHEPVVQRKGHHVNSMPKSQTPLPSTVEERRARTLEAVEMRLAKLDREISSKCGDANSSSTPPSKES